MPIFGSLVISAVIATTPATPLPWFDLNDYPTKAFEHEWQGTTNFDVIVDPQGRSTDCRIAKSSGHEILDRSACWVAMKRARFNPAIGADGQHAFGVYRSQVVWSRPDRAGLQRDLGPDLEVSVNQLPPGTPAAVKLAYFVDTAGNPSACTALPDSAQQPKQLVDLACQALFQQLPHAALTVNGASVAVVKTAAVKVIAQN
jgi:TonB family protein